jgi:phosphatidylinositol-3-phosphatase
LRYLSAAVGLAAGLAALLAGTAALPAGAAATPAAHHSASHSSSTAAKSAAAPHVMYIMMENTDYSQTAGSPAMPYLSELARQYAQFPQSYGWTYPSLPNYMEFLAGSTLSPGIRAECDPGQSGCTKPLHAETLVDQMEAAGISWHAYFQDDVSGCNDNPADFFHGNYDVEHNAFAYLADFPTQCHHLSNFGPLLSNLSSSQPADFNWVIPDLDNDGGDNGTMSSGDTWLSAELPQIMNTPWYRQGGQIVISYDTGYEDGQGYNGSNGGRIPCVVVSAHTKGMGLVTLPHNTAGLLRSVEHVYGLPYLGDATDPNNGSLGDALVPGRPAGRPAAQIFQGAVVGTGTGSKGEVTGVRGQSLAFNGVYRYPSGSTVEVGENADGQGVVATSALGSVAVPGTSNLESVSCTSPSRCYAVGLATANSDEGVLVTITNGQPTTVKTLPAWYGLYGISCPAATTCEAVGYDTADIADAVTTITNGVAAAPAPVTGGGEWLNAISCPTATDCYAAGLVNYIPSIVPIVNGTPGAPVTVPGAWYVNGIDCTSAGNCVVVGENSTQEGIVSTLAGGKAGTTQNVAGTEYLYGVGCTQGAGCVLAGASQVGATGYSHGVLAQDVNGAVGGLRDLANTNGLGQVACGASLDSCTTIGAAIKP